MKAIPINPDQIHFRPETDRDRCHLGLMLVRGCLIEHGRDAESGEIIHATARVVVACEDRNGSGNR